MSYHDVPWTNAVRMSTKAAFMRGNHCDRNMRVVADQADIGR